jgi:hypothetical protein
MQTRPPPFPLCPAPSSRHGLQKGHRCHPSLSFLSHGTPFTEAPPSSKSFSELTHAILRSPEPPPPQDFEPPPPPLPYCGELSFPATPTSISVRLTLVFLPQCCRSPSQPPPIIGATDVVGTPSPLRRRTTSSVTDSLGEPHCPLLARRLPLSALVLHMKTLSQAGRQ